MEVEEDDDEEEDDEDADLIPPEPTKDLIRAKMPLRLSPNKYALCWLGLRVDSTRGRDV